MGEVSLVDEMNSHKHISFHFPSCFAMCSSEPKEAEHRSREKMPREQIHPLVVSRKRGHPGSPVVSPAWPCLRHNGQAGAALRGSEKATNWGGGGGGGRKGEPGTRNDTRPPTLIPRFGQSSPSKAFSFLQAWALVSVL